MRRACIALAGVLGCVVLLAILLIALLWTAGNTATGRMALERLTERLSGHTVLLSGLGGSLPLRPTLDSLVLRDNRGVWLTAEHVAIVWAPLRLLERQIDIDSLTASKVHMERAPVSDQPSRAVSVPHIAIGRFTLPQVELGAPLVGYPAGFSAQGSLDLRALDTASGDLVARRLGGEGDYALHLRLDRRQLDALLTVHEPAGGPLAQLLALPGLGPLSATLKVDGPRAAERVGLLLDAGDLHARLDGAVDLVHGAADLRYSFDSSALAPRSDLAWSNLMLRGEWHGSLAAHQAKAQVDIVGLRAGPDVRIGKLHAELAGLAGGLTAHAEISALTLPGPEPELLNHAPVSIDAALDLADATRPLTLSASHPLMQLHASATTALGSAQRGSLELRVPDLAPLGGLTHVAAHGALNVTAQVNRGTDNGSLVLGADLTLTDDEPAWLRPFGARVALKLSGSWSNQSVAVQSASVVGKGISLRADGSASRPAAGDGPDRFEDLRLRWQAQVADLHDLSTVLAGNLEASGELHGNPESLSGDADIESRLSVHGSPRGGVHAKLSATGLPGHPAIRVLMDGTLDEAPLRIDAAVEPARDRGYHVKIRRAEWKSAQVEGDLTANAEFARSRGGLHMTFGQLSDLDRILDTSLGGSLTGTFGMEPGAPGRGAASFDFDAHGLAIGSVVGDAHLHGSGPSNAVALDFRAQIPALRGKPASLTATAVADADRRILNLSALSVLYRGQDVHLTKPAQLSLSAGLSVDDFTLAAGRSTLEIRGRWAPTLDLNAALLLDPTLVNAEYAGLISSGTVRGGAELKGTVAHPTGTVTLLGDDIHFSDEVTVGLPPVNFHAEAKLADATATLAAALRAGSASQFTIGGVVPLDAAPVLALKLGGRMDLNLVNPLLEARGLRASGTLTVDARVSGGFGAPQVSGGIQLTDGSVRDYARGVNLTNIAADIAGDEAQLTIKTFTAKSASGNVAMTGSIGILKSGIPIDLRITARNAQPVTTSIITAALDADLRVAGTAAERIGVTGTVHVNRATIGIPDSLPPDVAVLDVRRRGRAAPQPAAQPLIVDLDLLLDAPQGVLVQGRGLDAEMGGKIKITGTSADPVVTGDFNLRSGRGTFTIAGNTLTFSEGRIGFDGAGLRKKIDPTLDFTASTTVTDPTSGLSKVTLRITGLADAPQFSLTSDTNLPQDQIMSLLLFGEPPAQLSALQVAEIGAALYTLTGAGSGGGNPLVKLQKSLGLDRLTVGANTTTSATGATENSGAAIAAGRYVTRRIYVEGRQTTTGTSQVGVDVDLTKHLKLQTRLGNGTATVQGTTPENDPGSSIGLNYQFEY